MKKFLLLVVIFFIIFTFNLLSDPGKTKKSFCNIYKDINGDGWITYDYFRTLHRLKNSKPILNSKVIESMNFKDDNRIEMFQIRPNPVMNYAVIDLLVNITGKITVYSFDNLLTKQLYFEGNLSQGRHSIHLDLSKTNKGLVIIYVEIGGNITFQKLIKN